VLVDSAFVSSALATVSGGEELAVSRAPPGAYARTVVSTASGFVVATGGRVRCPTEVGRVLLVLDTWGTEGVDFAAGGAGSAVLDASVTDVSLRLRVSGKVRSGCCATLFFAGTRSSRPPEQADRAAIPISTTPSCFIVPPEVSHSSFSFL
jgi:hypothetical protein